MTTKIDPKIERLRKLRARLTLFGAQCLSIKTKEGDIVPLRLNTAQKYAHDRLEDQLKRTGRVRALFLKGRQQGISTYVAARYYHKASMRKGTNVYILAHEQPASDNLFGIVERYQRKNPMAPHTGVSNAKELEFDRLDSRYTVATAGQKAGGRSRTTKLFHGSEVAFWSNASEHFASSVQTVPDADGTEIILESTANGPSGEFYERWQDAEAGLSDYEAIFIPWFWQEEYRRPVPEGFELSDEAEEDEMSEVEYAAAFDLDMEQMAWRRNKIAELRSIKLFNQEYPATAQMAFVSAEAETYISAISVLRARKRTDVTPGGPLVLGVDPAGEGGDRFSVAARQGYAVPWVKWRNKVDTTEAIYWLKELIDEHKPDEVAVDAGGIGYAVISGVRALGPAYQQVVKAVNFGAKSQAKKARPEMPGPKNRRAEMWKRCKEWLESEEGAQLPDLDVIQADLTAPQIKPQYDNSLLLESKEEMRKRGVRSPDLGDAICLTFANLNVKAGDRTSAKPKVHGQPDEQRREDTGLSFTGQGRRQGWMV